MLERAEEERLEALDREALMEAFQGLPVRLREVGKARWLDGRTRRETAAKLNLTVDAVRVAEEKARLMVIDLFAGRAP